MSRALVVCTLLLLGGGQEPAGSVHPHAALTAYVRGPRQLVAGSPAAVRIRTQRSLSADEHGPWPGAKVGLSLEGKGLSKQLFEGEAGADGEASARFTVPEWPHGAYTLVVRASAAGRQYTHRAPVELSSRGKVLLQSDKPLYQPGQTIHLRAVAVRPQDMKPVAQEELVFEVLDPRENRVFTQKTRTSEFGVGWADFELGGEILLGAYRARARVANGGAEPAELELKVERYALPKFKVALEPEKSWLRGGEKARVHLEARYFFGKPVRGAKVKVEAGFGREGLFDASRRLAATTDEHGRATLALDVPQLTGERAAQELVLRAEITDSAGHTERGTRGVPVSASGLELELVAEGSELVGGVPNRLYAVASRPDGSPVEGAEVVLRVPPAPGEPPRKVAQARTNAAGIAELTHEPPLRVPAHASARCLEVAVSVSRSGEGRSASRCVPLRLPTVCSSSSDAGGQRREVCQPGPLLLRPDRAIYPFGAPLRLELLAPRATGTALVDVVKDGQTVDTSTVELRDGRGELVLPPDPRRFGTLQLQAYWAGDGRAARQGSSRLVFVERPSALRVEARAEGGKDGVFRPGEAGRLRLKVVDASSGTPARAALGLVMVDKALLALRPVRPAHARSYFQLTEAATQHAQKLKLRPGGMDLATLVEDGAADSVQELAARVLLAGAAPPWAVGFEEDGFMRLIAEAAARKARVEEAVRHYASGHQLGERVPNTRAGWRFRKNLLAQMVTDGALAPRDAKDPWGRPYPLEVLTAQLGRFEDWAQLELDERLSGIYRALAAEARAGRLAVDGGTAKKPTFRFGAEELSRLGEEGKLAKGVLVDPWGAPWRVVEEKRVRWISGVRSRFVVVSSGPDGLPATRDDRFPADVSEPGLLAAIGVQGGAVGFGGLGLRGTGRGGGGYGSGAGVGHLGGRASRAVSISMGSARLHEGRQPARVRDSFPETLLWRPELVTDAQGEATVDLTFADSITTWLLSADAIAADGRLGSSSLEVRVFQDFFVDLDLPPVLTQGDELSVPVAVYNYLPRPQRVTLRLEDAPWFARLEGPTQSIDLAPEEVGVRHFRIRARAVGRQRLTVHATGTAAADAIRREVEVFPDGVEQVASFQDRLRAGAREVRHAVLVPAAAIAGTPRSTLKLYPGLSAHVMEGLDGMLRMPSGCFEQTSSTTYPNALILEYLRKTKKATPELEDRARRYLSAGYQKLLSYEVRGGGFSWFGDAPANQVLTAYGLEEFVDMAKVFPVDPRVIERTRAWLVSRQQADGSWRVEKSPIQEGATDHYEAHAVRTTAYIALALRKAGALKEVVDRAARYVRRQLDPDADAYTLSLAVQLLPGDGLAEKLWSRRLAAGKAAYFPAPPGKTLTYGAGKSGEVETTARAALALLSSRGPADRVEQAVSYLIASKDSLGNWYSTQATIRALQALLELEEARGRAREGRVLVEVNGRPAGVLEVRGGEAGELVQTLELDVATPGRHEVGLRFEGKGEVSYQLVSLFHEPRREGERAEQGFLSVRTLLEAGEVSVGEEVEQTVLVRASEAIAMPVVRAGIPPGFHVDEAALERLVLERHVDRYERGAREVIFYLSKLPARQEVWLPVKLVARMPLAVQVPPAVVYEYYQPERRAEGAPARIEARL